MNTRYGAGDAKIGEIVGGDKQEGSKLKKQFLAKTKGLNKLVQVVQQKAKRGYLIGLTGRRLYIRSPHAALNVLLQSAGAYVMKYYVVELDKQLRKHNINYMFVGNIHDEVQIQVKEEQAELTAKLAVEAFATVTNILSFNCRLDGEAKIGDNWYDTH